MDNTLWHFGDSYSRWGNEPIGFSEFIAKNYNLKHNHLGISGHSNELIFGDILRNLNNFKKGDLIIINWSFFTRTTYVDNDNNILSLNNIIAGIKPQTSVNYNLYSDDYLRFLIDESHTFQKEYSIKLFKNLVNPLLNYLIQKEITPISSFNCFVSNEIIDRRISYEMIETPNTIKWIRDNFGYKNFLGVNFFEGDEQDHYKNGIQEKLANKWIEKIKYQKII